MIYVNNTTTDTTHVASDWSSWPTWADGHGKTLCGKKIATHWTFDGSTTCGITATCATCKKIAGAAK